MREIIFRGKRTDNGEWIEGCYYKYSYVMGEGHFINNAEYDIAVVPETVCQYTGVTDKNETKIFEGDIVKVRLQNGYLNFRVLFYYGMFRLNSLDDRFYIPIEPYEMEVIGNIYDNPELLGGE